MSEVDRSGMFFQLLAQNQASIQSLVNDHRQIRSVLADHSARLSNLESNHECCKNCSVELNQLKELRRRGGGTAEIKIGGIPVENNTAFSALAEELLGVLKLQDLCNDILEVRELKAKNVMDAEAAPNTNVNAQNNNGHNRSSAFIILNRNSLVVMF